MTLTTTRPFSFQHWSSLLWNELDISLLTLVPSLYRLFVRKKWEVFCNFSTLSLRVTAGENHFREVGATKYDCTREPNIDGTLFRHKLRVISFGLPFVICNSFSKSEAKLPHTDIWSTSAAADASARSIFSRVNIYFCERIIKINISQLTLKNL